VTSVIGKRVVSPDGARRRRGTGSCFSPNALYARPMALRQLYTDAGSIIRQGQREAAAAHQQNAR
jgi:hypothetical protein